MEQDKRNEAKFEKKKLPMSISPGAQRISVPAGVAQRPSAAAAPASTNNINGILNEIQKVEQELQTLQQHGPKW